MVSATRDPVERTIGRSRRSEGYGARSLGMSLTVIAAASPTRFRLGAFVPHPSSAT
jgi:hypothetical protein